MVKAKCEAVAAMKADGAKVGEEVRFYVDGKLVKTLHVTDSKHFGEFKEGEEYEVEPDAAPAHAEHAQ